MLIRKLIETLYKQNIHKRKAIINRNEKTVI